MLTRRHLLQQTLLATATTATSRLAHLARPSDELRLAVVGLNGRGVDHIEALRKLPGVKVLALCDVDEAVLARESKKFRERGERVDVQVDFRHLLERKDIDAVSIATPNHWHALQTIWACQAGKDVYVEKPVAHSFLECERIVAAARKYERIVQSGLQSRASPAIRAAIDWLRAGHLGELELVRGLCYKPRPSIGKTTGNQKIPDSVDYDLWCGPAPLAPLRRTRLHYDWHWFFSTGDGDLGNQGVHQMDVARWILGAEDLPLSVISLGERLGYEDDGQTPNTQMVFHAFEPVPLLFEVRGLPRDAAAQAADWSLGMDEYLGVKIGVVAHCSGGTLRVPSTSGAVACDLDGKELQRWEEAGDPFANWVAALRSRKSEELAAELEVGARSSALCHLGNVSHRVGKHLKPAELRKALASSAILTGTFERMLAHLGANQVDLEKTPLVLGPCLELDQTATCFRDNPHANELLAGSHREPFVLPESI